jgi:hypothetical protein
VQTPDFWPNVLRQSRFLSAVDLVQADRFRRKVVQEMARIFSEVDLLLVLAADVSRSIDSEKFQLQREGYATAVSDPRVLEAIKSGRAGRIGLSFVEWSGLTSQRIVIDWTTIGAAPPMRTPATSVARAVRRAMP